MSKIMIEPGFPMIELKKRSEIHLARKLWHMTGVSAMALVYIYAPYSVAMSLLLVAWLLFVPLDFLRQKSVALNDVMTHLFRPIMRDNEAKGLAGTTFLLTGVGIVALLFPRAIVIPTLFFLAFADPFASYFGIRFGKDKIFGHKSLQGTMAAFFVCTLIMVIFLSRQAQVHDRVVILSLLGGLTGALAELIPFGKLDDNLTLPVFSATFLWLLLYSFGAL